MNLVILYLRTALFLHVRMYSTNSFLEFILRPCDPEWKEDLEDADDSLAEEEEEDSKGLYVVAGAKRAPKRKRGSVPTSRAKWAGEVKDESEAEEGGGDGDDDCRPSSPPPSPPSRRRRRRRHRQWRPKTLVEAEAEAEAAEEEKKEEEAQRLEGAECAVDRWARVLARGKGPPAFCACLIRLSCPQRGSLPRHAGGRPVHVPHGGGAVGAAGRARALRQEQQDSGSIPGVVWMWVAVAEMPYKRFYAGTQPVLASQLASGISIFCDGSRINSQTGCGYVIQKGEEILEMRAINLDSRNSVYQAEVCAIKSAIDTWKNGRQYRRNSLLRQPIGTGVPKEILCSIKASKGMYK